MSGDEASRSEERVLGRQLLATLEGCDARALDEPAGLEAALTESVHAIGARVLRVMSHRFEPQGVTVAAVLSESHAVLHTWPERGLLTLDLFTCNLGSKPEAALAPLLATVGGAVAHSEVIVRRAPLTQEQPA